MISLQRITNHQAFTTIFGKIPTFIHSEVLDVQLKRDGPTLSIRLLTKEFVRNKPKRWSEWDVVYVELSFFGLQNLRIFDYGTNNTIVQFKVQNKEEEGVLEIICDNGMAITCTFDWIRVEKVTPGLIGN